MRLTLSQASRRMISTPLSSSSPALDFLPLFHKDEGRKPKAGSWDGPQAYSTTPIGVERRKVGSREETTLATRNHSATRWSQKRKRKDGCCTERGEELPLLGPYSLSPTLLRGQDLLPLVLERSIGERGREVSPTFD